MSRDFLRIVLLVFLFPLVDEYIPADLFYGGIGMLKSLWSCHYFLKFRECLFLLILMFFHRSIRELDGRGYSGELRNF